MSVSKKQMHNIEEEQRRILRKKEEKLCYPILSEYLKISSSNELDEKEKKNALSFWKAGKLMELMRLLKDRINRPIVTHAITFILSLEREEKLSGMNASYLNNDTQREFRKILRSELIENLSN